VYSRYLRGDLEIFGGCRGDIKWVFWRYWMGAWRYLMGAWTYLMGVLELFYECPGDI